MAEKRPTLKVFHFDRLAGCHPDLVKFLGWWQIHGSFPITIPPDGGLRVSELAQMHLFVAGKSRAKTLQDTPHGRGAAVDAWPAILDPTGRWVAGIHLGKDAQGRALLKRFGTLAKDHNLDWGGDFLPLDDEGLGFDPAHVQCKNWRDLPYPLPTT